MAIPSIIDPVPDMVHASTFAGMRDHYRIWLYTAWTAFAIAAVTVLLFFFQVRQLLEDRDTLREGLRQAHVARVGVVKPTAELDNQCAAWLFQTNLKDARKRVCKGR